MSKTSPRSYSPADITPCCADCAHTIQDLNGLLCLEALQITVPYAWCPRWKSKGRKDNGKPEL